MLNITFKERQQWSRRRSCCISSWLRAGPPLPALPSDIGIFWQSDRSHHTVHRQHRPTQRGNSSENCDLQCAEHAKSQAIDFLLFFRVMHLKPPHRPASIGPINHSINNLFLRVCSG